MTAEDDFWNTSSSSGFNFDDDEDNANVQLKSPGSSDIFFASHADKSSSLSIHSIISKRDLCLILGDTDLKHRHKVVPPVEETIQNMVFGRKYVLTEYRSLEYKIELLDRSILTGDGNVILTVVLYLAKTLGRSVFINILSKRESAIRHYSSYLIFHNRLQDLADLYMATGYNSNWKVLLFLILKNAPHNEAVLQRLDKNLTYLQSGANWKDTVAELNDYKCFLKWQIDKRSKADSPVQELAVLCRDNFDSNKDNGVNTFRQLMKLSDFQFEWIQLNTLAMLQQWKKLMNVFISENWLTKKKTLKTCLRGELFISNLHKHGAPINVLQEFLTSNAFDQETSLMFAKKMHCHRFVIDYYISQKDRLALLAYKSNLASQSEDFFYLENALYSSDKSWKN